MVWRIRSSGGIAGTGEATWRRADFIADIAPRRAPVVTFLARRRLPKRADHEAAGFDDAPTSCTPSRDDRAGRRRDGRRRPRRRRPARSARVRAALRPLRRSGLSLLL